jgi:NTP pyrophosphatase (non-canonical NTP hydrolase)
LNKRNEDDFDEGTTIKDWGAFLGDLNVLNAFAAMMRKKERKPFFQLRVVKWAINCFPKDEVFVRQERVRRFFEEAVELSQACALTREEAHELVDEKFNQQEGLKQQEVGGVMTTLAVLCCLHNIDMLEEGENELQRITDRIDEIRERHAKKAKPWKYKGD